VVFNTSNLSDSGSPLSFSNHTKDPQLGDTVDMKIALLAK
jgi:hypothetical protein